MSLLAAQIAEGEGRIEEAADLYEAVLERDELPLEALINLIVLYWRATDLGIAAANHFREGFFEYAGRRIGELLEHAARAVPGNPQARFWKRYIEWADLGEPFSQEECRAMLKEHPEYREPVMFLFMTSQRRECVEEALDLFLDKEKDETVRANYVRSIVEPRGAGRADAESEELRSVRLEAERLMKGPRRK